MTAPEWLFAQHSKLVWHQSLIPITMRLFTVDYCQKSAQNDEFGQANGYLIKQPSGLIP